LLIRDSEENLKEAIDKNQSKAISNIKQCASKVWKGKKHLINVLSNVYISD